MDRGADMREIGGRSWRKLPSLGGIGAVIVVGMTVMCLASLPYTMGRVGRLEASRLPPAATEDQSTRAMESRHRPRRFEATDSDLALLPPFWARHAPDERERVDRHAAAHGETPRPMLGTDRLGRSVLARVLAGGAISLSVGLSAAAIAVIIGTLYGTVAGWHGGRVDALMMRIVDVLFGLPYILLVVLLAVAAGGLVEAGGHSQAPLLFRRTLGAFDRDTLNVVTLLVAIGGVSWLTMARVIRGQVLSLKQRPFMEACRATGVPLRRQFTHHLLPNLLGPIIVYGTLTVPAAILSESFLSFLGIGIQEPLPSWGNLAAAGLSELNTVRVRWWLLLWPCLFIAATLIGLNFMGEALRDRFDPMRRNN